jgi:predicted N-acetyltransferase YhbS
MSRTSTASPPRSPGEPVPADVDVAPRPRDGNLADGPAVIDHLFNHAALLPRVARAIHEEFWVGRDGYSREDLERLLGDATSIAQLPLCLVALVDEEFVGTVSLIDNDDPSRPHLHPWLAALVVVETHRRHRIGTALVERLLELAARLGYDAVYLGTDAPAFYARFGASFHEQARPDLVIMRCPTRGR